MSYAEVKDLRDYLGFQPGVDEEQSLMLQDALNAAVEAVNAYCGRTFGPAGSSETRVFDGGTHVVLIDDAATVTLVEESSNRHTWVVADSSLYWTDPANKLPKTTLNANSSFSNHVRVTGTWGYGSIPAAVKRATLMMAARLHKRRESVTGTEGWGEYGVIRVTRNDSDVMQLLGPLRRGDSMGLA